RDFASHDFLSDRGESLGEGDQRRLVNLLVEQIEFADVIVLNKVTDAGVDRRDAAMKIIKSLNPDARLIETDYARVETKEILDTGLFDFAKAQDHPLWAKELYGFADHVPETEEYGVSSFVYRARDPFDPVKLHAVLNGPLPGVIRAKGHFWIATRPDWVAEFSLAGALSSVAPLGPWWAAVPRERWPASDSGQSYLARHWQEPFGDRRQELVFIGAGMDAVAITAALDAALVPGAGYIPAQWAGKADPFPRWRQAA
ncbi:GTP-binding protein, partial [Thioclava sp. BHET1]